MKPIYEFLIWDNCKNNCKFCSQRISPRIINREQKITVLKEVINFLDSNNFERGSHILICGGEIFDSPPDFEILNNFFHDIVCKMLNNDIDLLYINTNLIYNNLTGVLNLLELISINHLFDRLKFTTSYDIKGRFKSENDRKLMLGNQLELTNKYSELKVVTNIILTKPACHKIINKELNINEFCKNYHCEVNLIPYIITDTSLAPERLEIFRALKQVDIDRPGYLKKYIPNICNNQSKYIYIYHDDKWNFTSCGMSPCSHSVNFKRYSLNNTSCFCCDLMEVFNARI